MKRVRISEILEDGWHDYQLTEEEHRHLVRVQRARSGEEVLVLDGAGHRYLAQLQLSDEHSSLLQPLIVDTEEDNAGLGLDAEPPYTISLVQGLPKADKLELVLQKGVELGATAFYPTVLQRSVVRLDARAAEKKLGRWEKIVGSAALQSGRACLPTVELLEGVTEVAERFSAGPGRLLLVPWEEEHYLSLKEACRNFREAQGEPEEVVVVIGPEGGLAAEEVACLQEAGFVPVSLGRRILRTETAGMAVLSALAYEFEWD